VRRLVPLVAFLLVVSACGGGRPKSCDGVADEAIGFVQELIDEVDANAADLGPGDLAGVSLPPADRFHDAAARIDEDAAGLGCDRKDLRRLVAERAGRLHAGTIVGRLVVDAVRSGGM